MDRSLRTRFLRNTGRGFAAWEYVRRNRQRGITLKLMKKGNKNDFRVCRSRDTQITIRIRVRDGNVRSYVPTVDEPNLLASRVSFAHQRSDDTSDRTFFGSDVEFVQRWTYSISGFHQADPDIRADPYLNKLLISHCDQALSARSAKRNSFESSVENVIAVHLPHGKARAREIARKLGVSQRTLARRLSSEGLTFASVLQRLKSDLAKRHLADETLSISEIAWLVGYQDVSAFTHAFKRWTGKAPSAIRQASR